MLWETSHPGGPQSLWLGTWGTNIRGECSTLAMPKSKGMSIAAIFGSWAPLVWMSEADKWEKVSSMQGLPFLQHPLWWLSKRLTLPVQEQRCHPMPLLPKSIMVRMARSIVICDSLFMCLCAVNNAAELLLLCLFIFSFYLGFGHWQLGTSDLD